MFRKTIAVTASTLLAGMAIASAPAASASDPALQPGKVPAKTLVVTIAGLQSGVNGRVRVTGPGTYRTTIKGNGTRTLSNLVPGRYRLKAKAVSTSSGKARATKKTRTTRVKVTAKKGAKVLVLYVTPGTV